MNSDITDLLAEWPYDASSTIRIVSAEDGRNVLQVRLPLGIEQYELDGRPDGKRPFGRESVLEEYEKRLEEHIRGNRTEEGFSLAHEDFLPLQAEGILYYYRYLLLFQTNDFERVVRDTGHNLRLSSLVEKYAELQEDKTSLLQYKPYILRMNAMARSMILLSRHEKERARDSLRDAMEKIRSLPDIDSPAFQFEKIRSINYLKSTLQQLDGVREDPGDILKKELDEAVKDENYEKAAEIRDKLRKLS